MNQTVITGNLTADIETREIQSKGAKAGDQHISKFTLGCNEGERVVFMPIEAWNMPHLAEHLHKGSKVLVAGSLKQDNWETDSGEKRSRIVLNAFKVEFLDPAPEFNGSGRAQKPSYSNSRQRGGRHQSAA